jgi:hypothetical protein
MDSKSLFLTANTESVYAFTWVDLSKGPVVIESPANVLGIVDNAWFEYVTDMGNAGPDKGKGGKYLFLPPGYDGEVPEGFFSYKSTTFGHVVLWRGFLKKGSPKAAVKGMKKGIKVYPLSQKAKPPKQKFVNLSGKSFNTIHANDYSFFEEVNAVIQREPKESGDPEIKGLLAAIGIEKGKSFAPSEAQKKLLQEAARVANATARALIFNGRNPAGYYYEDSAWINGFIGGSHEFKVNGVRLLDPRTVFFYYATFVTPAMAAKMVGAGSQYAGVVKDSDGVPFDGGKTYKLTLPADVPAKNFWSVVLYDNQTRSMLQTDQQFPSLNSERGIKKNKDGTTDVFFGPVAPKGKESNWIQTVPGKGWNMLLRLYGPLEPWFNKTWRPGEVVWQKEIPAVKAAAGKYKMTTDIPPGIVTPDTVETRIGKLSFVDGVPTDDTVKRVYDNLDFIRGVEAFLTAMPGASLVAIRQGFKDAGIDRNGVVGIFENLMDAKSLYLTGNTESIYAVTWLDLKDGPVVVESPPNTLGMVNDFFFRYVTDLGNAGPDKGKGGKYLFVPPGYKGPLPEGYFTYNSPTYNNVLFWRGFLKDGDAGPPVASLKASVSIYPLSNPAAGKETKFLNLSGHYHNTIHANDINYYKELKLLVDDELFTAFSPEILGLLAAIGIEKGKLFAPDDAMKAILKDAVAVGNATARALSFYQKGNAIASEGFIYSPDEHWFIPFVGGSHEFLRNGARLLDARTMFHYPYTAVTPAMAIKMVGLGSQYGVLTLDKDGNYLNGSNAYRLNLPKGIPVKNFWSIVIYDTETRSQLQTDQDFPSINSERNKVVTNEDGSTDIYFGPNPPDAQKQNWIQTVPEKGWFLILRLYGPLEPWFDQTWKPGQVELIR